MSRETCQVKECARYNPQGCSEYRIGKSCEHFELLTHLEAMRLEEQFKEHLKLSRLEMRR